MQNSIILGIESSCDDTAAAVIQNGKILANVANSQTIHEQYGGVVPELASRAHLSQIVPVVDLAMKKAKLTLKNLDAIAVTQGPGLMGSLLVGLNFAKGLALGIKKPLLGVNHLQAHSASAFIDANEAQFPVLNLLVSGGHTQIILMHDFFTYEILGQTLDDAAGEALDKAAKLLGLGYPGGPIVEKLALLGNAKSISFPAGKVPGLNFSFSGIKTSLLYYVRKQLEKKPDYLKTPENISDLCASYQFTIVSDLLKKLDLAIHLHKPKSIALTGGVSANQLLRSGVIELAKKNNTIALIPQMEYCTDNAAMIAFVGEKKLQLGFFDSIDIMPFSR